MARARADIAALVREAMAAIEIGNSGAVPLLLHRAESLAPAPADWRAIGDAWHAAGNAAAGGKAHLRAARISERDPENAAAIKALAADALEEAGCLLAARLEAHPSDVAAMRLKAELSVRLGHVAGARALLERALGLAPDYAPARLAMLALRPPAQRRSG